MRIVMDTATKKEKKMTAGINQKDKRHETANYHRTRMQRDLVVQRLREQGHRITKQRLMLLDVILEEECSCCKEIYYKVARQEPGIGAATVYRMVNLLEEIGAISRKNMYRIACGCVCEKENACTIELDDHTVKYLSAKKWNEVVLAGLKACGYIENQGIRSVAVRSCDCEDTDRESMIC